MDTARVVVKDGQREERVELTFLSFRMDRHELLLLRFFFDSFGSSSASSSTPPLQDHRSLSLAGSRSWSKAARRARRRSTTSATQSRKSSLSTFNFEKNCYLISFTLEDEIQCLSLSRRARNPSKRKQSKRIQSSSTSQSRNQNKPIYPSSHSLLLPLRKLRSLNSSNDQLHSSLLLGSHRQFQRHSLTCREGHPTPREDLSSSSADDSGEVEGVNGGGGGDFGSS